MPRSFTQPPAWTSKPGGWDTTGTREVFTSTSSLGIPDLLPQDFTTLPDDFRLQPYRTKRVDEGRDICHFYLDDYRFETTWNKPNAALIHLRRYWAVMTPDFSLYPQWPMVVNQWNTYRSQWLGRWWQPGVEGDPYRELERRGESRLLLRRHPARSDRKHRRAGHSPAACGGPLSCRR